VLGQASCLPLAISSDAAIICRQKRTQCGTYVAGTCEQGSSVGEFRLDLSAASWTQQLHHIKVLEELVSRGTDDLKALRKVMTRALKDATQKAHVNSTGGTSFRAVAKALAGVLSRYQLDWSWRGPISSQPPWSRRRSLGCGYSQGHCP